MQDRPKIYRHYSHGSARYLETTKSWCNKTAPELVLPPKHPKSGSWYKKDLSLLSTISSRKKANLAMANLKPSASGDNCLWKPPGTAKKINTPLLPPTSARRPRTTRNLSMEISVRRMKRTEKVAETPKSQISMPIWNPYEDSFRRSNRWFLSKD